MKTEHTHIYTLKTIKCLKLAINTLQKAGLKEKTSGKKNYLGKTVFDEGLRL